MYDSIERTGHVKARDIALLCTAAGTAGIAAAAAVKAKADEKRKRAEKSPVNEKGNILKKSVQSTDKAFVGKYDVTFEPVYTDVSHTSVDSLFYTENKGLLALCTREGQPVCFEYSLSGHSEKEVRRPATVGCAAISDGCTVFLNGKGVVFSYDDPDREPVAIKINSPRYVSAENGMICVFSDSLLYVYSPDAKLIKTVSLCAMFDIKESDICDAEETDDSFSTYEVTVTKTCSLGKTGITVLLSDDGRAFLTALEDDFCTLEKAYDNIIDVCARGDNAYFLCTLDDGYGLIKMQLSEDGCETAGKYRLCGKDTVPVKLISMEYGLAVLSDSGKVHGMLAGSEDDACRNACKAAVRDINSAFSNIRVQDIFPADNGFWVLVDGNLNRVSIASS